jgi:hypothetical protein
MADAEQAAREAVAGRRVRRAALLAWIACAVVIWNVVFDGIVVQAGREYLTIQALGRQGRGPSVTLREIMHPAAARAARTATIAGGAIGAAGILAVWASARLGAGRSAGRTQ